MTYRFGPFELDVEGYRLTREGEVVQAEPRVLELLSYLVARRGSLVDKEELVREVWGGAFVADASIARAVSEARAALGDTSDKQRWIATVYGRGYSFVGEAEELGDELEDPSRPAYRRPAIALSAVLLLVAVAGVLLWRARQDAGGAGARTGVPVRLAVLPFESIGHGDEGWFAAGLTEEITTRLATVDDLAVISRTSSERYGEAVLETVAEELGVAYVLEGGVRLEVGPDGSPRRIRITPQLIRVVDDSHVWAEIYEREIDDIFAVQADIAARVTEALDLELSSAQVAELAEPPTRDMKAYAAYLRGLELESRVVGVDRDMEAYAAYLRGLELESQVGTVDKYVQAAGMFERAIELDEGFAAAWAHLAIARLGIYDMYLSNTWDEARAALERARELAPDSLGTLLAEGILSYRGPRPDHEKAAAILQALISRAPSSADAHEHLGRVRRDQGRYREALRHLERAVDLDRRHARAPFVLADTYMAMRRFEDSDAMWRRVIGEAPDNARAWVQWAGNQVLWRGDLDAARDILERRPRGVEISIFARAYLALCEGRPEAVVKLAEGIEPEDLLIDPYPLFYILQSYRKMGREDLALRLASDLVEHGWSLKDRFPEHPYSYIKLAYPLALIGRGEEAVAHAQKAHELMARERSYTAPGMLERLAVIEMELGHEEQAIARIAELLETDYQSPLTRERLRIEPWWDPLRDHPEFQALLQSGS